MSAPRTQGSIRKRLLVLLLLSAAVISVLLYLVIQSVFRQLAQESQDNILAASAISIMDNARVADGEISIDLPYSALSMLDNVTDERAFYAIRLADEFLTGYRNLPQPSVFSASNTAFDSAVYLGEEVRIASTRRIFTTRQGPAFLEISVAQTLAGFNRSLARISQISLGIGVGFFMLSAVVALLIARNTIQPLDVLTESVSRRGPSDLRPVRSPVPSEMAPLVSSLNGLMARLKASLSRSEDLIVEAAHRVRTPLAIVRTQAEITLRRVEKPENRQAVREMIKAIDESSRTAGQLLDHAMVSFRSDNLSAEAVNLKSLAEDTVERLRPITELKEIDLTTGRLDDAVTLGDPILIQNALLNLLDNAIKYSNRESKVDLRVEKNGTMAKISISDTGPGFPDAETTALLKRFARGTNAGGVIGSGLGLTIVDEVAQAHGGQLHLSNLEGGGACVTLSFPLR